MVLELGAGAAASHFNAELPGCTKGGHRSMGDRVLQGSAGVILEGPAQSVSH